MLFLTYSFQCYLLALYDSFRVRDLLPLGTFHFSLSFVNPDTPGLQERCGGRPVEHAMPCFEVRGEYDQKQPGDLHRAAGVEGKFAKVHAALRIQVGLVSAFTVPQTIRLLDFGTQVA